MKPEEAIRLAELYVKRLKERPTDYSKERELWFIALQTLISIAERVNEEELEKWLEDNVAEYLDLDGYLQGRGYKLLAQAIIKDIMK